MNIKRTLSLLLLLSITSARSEEAPFLEDWIGNSGGNYIAITIDGESCRVPLSPIEGDFSLSFGDFAPKVTLNVGAEGLGFVTRHGKLQTTDSNLRLTVGKTFSQALSPQMVAFALPSGQLVALTSIYAYLTAASPASTMTDNAPQEVEKASHKKKKGNAKKAKMHTADEQKKALAAVQTSGQEEALTEEMRKNVEEVLTLFFSGSHTLETCSYSEVKGYRFQNSLGGGNTWLVLLPAMVQAK